MMRIWQCALLLAAVLSVACGSHRHRGLTAADAAAVDKDVRAFARVVAQDVSQEGPAAWRRHFADSPAFFMASDGQLAFPNSAAATAGIQAFARTIKTISLEWGDDLRVDPLTPRLAVMAASWREIRVDAAGARVDQAGFFTGVVEYRDGRWQFRDAHWSVAHPAAPR
jgi:hypothetical protein